MRGDVPRLSDVTLTANEISCAEHLARFFPKVAAAHILVQITVLRSGNGHMQEAATLEFASEQHVIFLSTLPLEFNDRVRIARHASTQSAEAAVVAVQYREGRKAVAVRFSNGPCNWVTQT